MAEIKVEKTIHEYLQEVRNILANEVDMKKTGRGDTGKRTYSYFDMPDYKPIATKLFNERGMCSIFSIGYDPNGIEMCTLKIVKGAEMIVFQAPSAESTTSPNPIQNLGAKITYLRRYMDMIALDLVENDIVEISDNSKAVTPGIQRATPKQVDMIRKLYDEENVAKMIEFFGIQSLEDLSVQQASDVIQKKVKK